MTFERSYGAGSERGVVLPPHAATATRGPPYDASTLVLLDDVQLFFDYLVRNIQSCAAAVNAGVGPKRVSFGLQMRWYRLAPRRLGLCFFTNRGDRLHRWLRSLVEGLPCVTGDDGGSYWKSLSCRLALAPLRNRQ